MPMNSGKDYVAREVSVAQPLMAAGPVGGNQGGDFVIQAIPILEAGARTGISTTDVRAGLGVGKDGDPMFTLQSGKQHAVAVGYANAGHFGTMKEVSVSDPLRAKDGDTGNGGETLVAMSVALRGREGGATAELGGEQAYALRAANGGGSDPYVLAFSCKDHGADATRDIAPTMRAMGHSGSHANAGGQLAVCVTGSVTHTLRAEGFDASEDGTGRGQPIVVHGTQDPCVGDVAFALGRNNGGENALFVTTMAVRRLMPVECHRLQGFPDNWCAVPINGKIAADGPQYKQLGNSWATNHARWVGTRLDAEIRRLDALDAATLNFSYDDSLLLWAMVE